MEITARSPWNSEVALIRFCCTLHCSRGYATVLERSCDKGERFRERKNNLVDLLKGSVSVRFCCQPALRRLYFCCRFSFKIAPSLAGGTPYLVSCVPINRWLTCLGEKPFNHYHIRHCVSNVCRRNSKISLQVIIPALKFWFPFHYILSFIHLHANVPNLVEI